MISWGYGAEIAARISDELFDTRPATSRKSPQWTLFVGYAPQLEQILPQIDDLVSAINKLNAF